LIYDIIYLLTAVGLTTSGKSTSTHLNTNSI